MENENILIEELLFIESEISKKNITPEIYNIISLLKRRVDLGRRINEIE